MTDEITNQSPEIKEVQIHYTCKGITPSIPEVTYYLAYTKEDAIKALKAYQEPQFDIPKLIRCIKGNSFESENLMVNMQVNETGKLIEAIDNGEFEKEPCPKCDEMQMRNKGIDSRKSTTVKEWRFNNCPFCGRKLEVTE